jgi:3-oxoacyl-[acyl-carrier protein] reductase
MRTAAEKAVERYGSLDILCANAGIFPSSSLVELSGDQWDEVFNVNAKGTLFSVQASLPFLRKSNAGRIVVCGPQKLCCKENHRLRPTALNG